MFLKTIFAVFVALAAFVSGQEDVNCTSFVHQGFLIDTYCWNAPNHIAADGANMLTNPEDHTKMCMLMPPCKAGYTLLQQKDDGTYEPKYTLDEASTAQAVEWVEASTAENNFLVDIEGSACGDVVIGIDTIALASDAATADEPAAPAEGDGSTTSGAGKAASLVSAASVIAVAASQILL